MSTKSKQSVSSTQHVKDKLNSATQYLWTFLHCRNLTEAENEGAEQMNSNKLCVYCRFMFNANHGITPLTEAEAELLTKMCPYHHNKEQPRIIHSKPQDPGEICGLCTVVLRYNMERCVITGKFSNDPERCLASVKRPRRGYIFSNSNGGFESKENNSPTSSDEDYDDA
ncbi:Hypothetical predicted protein [Cloeon dipterum]|uniref:Uncharacterized protein n=1 Tax=Cloeon dipterum TaxID=197152 RepID=A0A8S1DK29_9INSE|nr:Hypothetical predicted protein [Cloeon dipterum]